MKKLLFFLIFVGLIVGGGVAAKPHVEKWIAEKKKVEFETVEVDRGEIKWYVQATGKVEPIVKVPIGSFVSGPITDIYVDYNQKVEKDEPLAKVDPRLYRAAVERDEASLMRAKAQVEQIKARLRQSTNELKRAIRLQKINEGYISQSEMDQMRFTREAQIAELKAAQLQIKQAQASLDNSELNLKYTDIRAPRSGIIIERKIEPGSTLAAQFQTPELFTLAPEMDERMWVHASVVEADVGHIQAAMDEKRGAEFYVDAYEEEMFKGEIIQVRQNPTAEQTVVSYPVIVEVENKSMKLRPGMTAYLSFEIDRAEDVLRIPDEAIRFVPKRENVREEDHEILDGKEEEERAAEAGETSAEKRIAASRRRRRRHVWVKEGEKLKGIEIEFGLSDGRYYELIEGEIEEGQELVFGIESKKK